MRSRSRAARAVLWRARHCAVLQRGQKRPRLRGGCEQSAVAHIFKDAARVRGKRGSSVGSCAFRVTDKRYHAGAFSKSKGPTIIRVILGSDPAREATAAPSTIARARERPQICGATPARLRVRRRSSGGGAPLRATSRSGAACGDPPFSRAVPLRRDGVARIIACISYRIFDMIHLL